MGWQPSPFSEQSWASWKLGSPRSAAPPFLHCLLPQLVPPRPLPPTSILCPPRGTNASGLPRTDTPAPDLVCSQLGPDRSDV